MTVERLLITAASAWYLSYALTNTDGALGIFARLREWGGGRWHGRINTYKTVKYVDKLLDLPTEVIDRQYHGLLDCVVCLIFWLALLIGLLQGLTVIECIAAAGVGLWLHGFTGWRYNV